MESIHKLKEILLKDNPVFGENGFYYEDWNSFNNSGITDRFDNQFFFRHLKDGVEKFGFRSVQGIDTITCQLRMVFQLQIEVNKKSAMMSIIGQLKKLNVKILAFSDDTNGIYFDEYVKEGDLSGFHLISVDVEIEEEVTARSFTCNPIQPCNC